MCCPKCSATTSGVVLKACSCRADIDAGHVPAGDHPHAARSGPQEVPQHARRIPDHHRGGGRWGSVQGEDLHGLPSWHQSFLCLDWPQEQLAALHAHGHKLKTGLMCAGPEGQSVGCHPLLSCAPGIL